VLDKSTVLFIGALPPYNLGYRAALVIVNCKGKDIITSIDTLLGTLSASVGPILISNDKLMKIYS
jgi:hypothetical protein